MFSMFSLFSMILCSENSFKKQEPKENDKMFNEETNEIIHKMISKSSKH